MQILQRTLQSIIGQLRALTPTAKLLIGSLMVILAMSLFLVSLYAGRENMSPLGLGPNISADARSRAVSFLEARHIPYQSQGTDVLVPASQKFTVLTQLTENQLIGPDQINFEKLISDDSPFRTSGQNRQRYLVAKMNVLASMISQMKGIERATVVLDQPEGAPGIGKSHIAPSASVTVLPRGDLSQSQVDAIAQLVAGSHAGLKVQNVAIVDARNGRYIQARTDELYNAGRYLDVKLAAEKHVKETLEGALDYIPGVRIAVNAQVDTSEVVQQKRAFDEPKIAPILDSSRTTTSTNQSGGAEPGVRSNVGASLASASRQASQMTDERTESKTLPAFGQHESQIRNGKGYPVQINATILVPRSYFVRLCQENKGDNSAQPDQATLDGIVQSESARIQQSVEPLIDTQAVEGAVAGKVTVSMIPDFGAVLASNISGNAEQSTSIVGNVATDGLVKYVTLGGLALLSLAMMFMMVRKATVREPLPTAAELVGIPPALAAAESDLVGEADEAAPALEGVELTDDAIRRRQMLDQITDMIDKTPEEAANLMRRWMKSESAKA
jgi:flagellar M-ring protein FliF